nr:MerR family transcriptional regulator [Acinetobacter sp. Marseille-Q1620]
MQEIDIGDLSKKVGVSTATIRFYESKGFIRSIGRKGLRRQYPEHTIQIMFLIILLKNNGLSLNEIGKIFILDCKINVDRDLVDEAMGKITNKISELNRLLSILKHVKSCPYEEHLSCPDFIKMLN